MLSIPTLLLALTIPIAQGFTLMDVSKNVRTSSQSVMMKSNQVEESKSNDALKGSISRRKVLVDLPLASISTAAAFTALPQIVNAIPDGKKVTGAEDGNLPDLPPEASRSYLQYRIPLQVAIDYYLFELKPKLSKIDDWGEVNQLFQTNNNRGQGQPNKIERDYTNTMRILLLSFPPDESESMRSSQFKFERAMQKITKTTAGVRRDLPIEIDSSAVTTAEEGWEEGRVALNEFLAVLNEATGLNEMKLIPDSGPDQIKKYGRSARRFFELTKKTKLCQNRGGPALSQAWGQLMISGYLQDNMDSCGSKYL